MNKLAKFIVKHKILIIGLTALISIASIVAMLYVNVNSDILSYLPDGYDMTEGMDFMRENFDMQGDAIIGVADVDYATMVAITDQIKAENGIKDGGVIWLGMILEMAEGGGQMADVVAELTSNEDILNLFYPKRNAGEPFTEETKLQKGKILPCGFLDIRVGVAKKLFHIRLPPYFILSDKPIFLPHWYPALPLA